MLVNNQYFVFPLGDSAATFDFGPTISKTANRKIRSMRMWIKSMSISGLNDQIIGYSSLCVTYNPVLIRRNFPGAESAFAAVAALLENAYRQSGDDPDTATARHLYIPVIYGEEFGPDLSLVSETLKISPQEIISLHSSTVYDVYMTGFVPGFSYLASLDQRLMIERKPQAVPVLTGSVGIAGGQTGVYPIDCTGGWQIIGRTPFSLFDAADPDPVKLEAGDQVSFYPISRADWDDSNR